MAEWTQDARERYLDEIKDKIERYGHAVQYVGGDPHALPFSYTVGLHPAHPELLLIGLLHPYDARGVLNDLATRARMRTSPFADGELVNIGGEHPVMAVEADARGAQEYCGVAWAIHGTADFPVLQILVPDTAGRFPGDPECAAPYSTVPVLRKALN